MEIKTPQSQKLSISLTPLIDVVFILLLFFMLSSKFVHWDSVTLAQSSQDKQSTKPTRILHLINNQGELMFGSPQQQVLLSSNSRKMPTDAAQLTLQQWIAEEPETLYLLSAESGVHTQALLDSLHRLKQIGVKHLSLYSAPATVSRQNSNEQYGSE